jgi:hypothetical protein
MEPEANTSDMNAGLANLEPEVHTTSSSSSEHVSQSQTSAMEELSQIKGNAPWVVADARVSEAIVIVPQLLPQCHLKVPTEATPKCTTTDASDMQEAQQQGLATEPLEENYLDPRTRLLEEITLPLPAPLLPLPTLIEQHHLNTEMPT